MFGCSRIVLPWISHSFILEFFFGGGCNHFIPFIQMQRFLEYLGFFFQIFILNDNINYSIVIIIRITFFILSKIKTFAELLEFLFCFLFVVFLGYYYWPGYFYINCDFNALNAFFITSLRSRILEINAVLNLIINHCSLMHCFNEDDYWYCLIELN